MSVNFEEQNMLKCPKHEEYSLHRANVRVCPKCGRILDANELFRLLKELGISDDLIKKIEEEISVREVYRHLEQ
jgi:transcription initiation factor IIE alpha subunit